MIKNYTTDNQHNRSFLRGLLPPKGWLVLVLFMMFLSTSVFANGGIGYKGIRINNKGSHTWYKAHNVAWGYNGCGSYMFNSAADFSGQNLGTFTTSDVLEISGFGVVGWTDNSDYVAGKLLYKVWKQGDAEPGTWSEYVVGNYNSPGSGVADVQCTSGQDRVAGALFGININQTVAGTYNLKVQALGRMQYVTGSFNANDGAEVTATFVVSPSPTITVSTTSLTAFADTCPSATSSNQTFTVSGTNLTANITVTAPTDFQVSTSSGSGFGSSVTLTQSGGTVSSTTIYARFAPGTAGSKSGNITATSTSATTRNVAVSGVAPAAGTYSYLRTLTATATINQGSNATLEGEGYAAGFTEAAGQATGSTVEFGYRASNTDPSSDGSWTWSTATFDRQNGNNDVLRANSFGSALGVGTYYYTFRFKLQGCSAWQYTGTSSTVWSSNSGVLTVRSAPVLAATTAASSITTTTATSGGNVTSDGGAAISERGIVYHTSSNPTTSNTKVTAAGTTGSFSANMTGLSPGTLYYVRAYAINAAGTSYGTEISFTTSVALPTLAATTINSNIIASTSASIASNVTSAGGGTVTERGIVYATTTTPTTSNTKVTNGTGTGTYNTTMSGLTPNTLYYVRSYAINSAGTEYGTQTTLTTLSPPTGISATSASPTSINLAWTRWAGDRAGVSTALDVMIVRSTDASFVAPTNTTTYTVGNTSLGGDTVIFNGGGTSFTDTGLTTGTTYYYAFYSEGWTYYSAAATASAAPQPIVATLAATTINSNNHVSATTASITSNITDNGGAAVTERGIVYATTTTPTTSSTKVTNGTGNGSYDTSMTGLTPGTRYYVRSYAINSAGTAYGAEVSFTTLMPPTTLTATPVTASTIDLAWTRWAGHRAGSDPTYDVMIVRSTDASFTAPTDGVAYTAGVSTIGGDLVIYKGSGTSVTDTGLTLSTQYYYAIYSEGWNYYSNSRTANATTPAASAPTLAATTAQTNVTSSNADSGGNVTADGGATVTERGLVFGTSSNPTLSNGTKVTTTGTTGSYTLGLSNLLSPSTTYYVRAYATNAAGTGYGTQITFTTSAASSSTSFYSDRIYFKNGSGADEKYFAAYNVVPNGGCTGNNTETVGTTGWNGRNLGTYTTGTVAKIGGFIVTKGIQNGNTPYMMYRVYETGTTPPSFTSQNMNYVGECVADGVDVNGSSQDKIWRFPLSNFTIPSAPGNYTIEVYFSRSGDHMGANGDQFINNGGNNYKANITVQRPTGVFSAKVALKKNSDSTVWYNANADTDCDPGSTTDFNNLNNIIVASDGFTLGGNFIATMAMTNPRLFYVLYAEGARPTSPTFTAINLTTSTTPSCSGTVYKYELGATTQLFASNTYTSGTYVLEVYFQGTNGGTEYYRKQDTSTNFKCFFNIPEPNDGNLNPTGTNISGIYESYIGQLILGLDDNGNPTTADRKISKVFDLDGSNGSSNNANFDLGETNPGVSFKVGMEAKVFTKGTHKACGCSSWYYLYKEGTTDPVESDFPLPAAGSTAVLYSQKWGSSARKFILMNSSMSWQGLNTPFQELGGSSVDGYGDNSPGFGSSTPDGTYNGQLGASATVTKFKDYKDRNAFSPASTNMVVDTPVNEVACPTCDGTYRIAVAFLCWVQSDSTKKCPDDSGFSTATDAPTIIYHRDINQNKIHNGVYLNPRHPNSPYFTSNKNSLPGTSVFYVSKLDVNASGGNTAYSGSWNNGTPTRGKNTTISSNYSTASGSFTTNNLTIADGVTLTVRAGEYVEVLNTATTTGTGKVVVEKGGNFVQRCNEKIPANGVPYPNIEHTHQTRTIASRDYVYWSSPIRENLMPTLTTAGMGRMFYWQGGAGGGWNRLTTTAADTFGAGKGFIAWNAGAAPAAFAPTFIGTATNGEVSVAVTKEDVYPDESDAAALATYSSNFNNYALLGNPYPCAIDAREFLVHANNQHIGGTVYIWTSNSRLSGGTKGVYDAGDYATYTLTGGTAASNTPEYAYGESSGTTYGNSSSYVADSNRMIYSGSGFFVLVKQNGDAFFNNEMRSITGNSKSSAGWALFKEQANADDKKEENRLWLSVRNEDGAYRQTLLGYFNGATEGYDSYLDAMVNSSNAVNIYTKSKDNHKLVIQARPESLLDANETVPLVLSSKEADDFYITVDMFEGKFKNKDIYLRDKKLGVDHDFSTGKYHFSTESGVYEDRFEIVYKDKPKASIEEPADANAPLKVAVADHLISISKAGQKIAKVELVNILGKQIAEKLYREPSEKVEIHDIIKANQVLIVKVTYADGSTETKKIIF